MTKLTEIVNGLTATDLEELIEQSKTRLKKLDKEKTVKLIMVGNCKSTKKYFSLSDEKIAIAYAHESIDKQFNESKESGYIHCVIHINTIQVPVSDYEKYLGHNND